MSNLTFADGHVQPNCLHEFYEQTFMVQHKYMNIEMLVSNEIMTIGLDDSNSARPCSTKILFGQDTGNVASSYNCMWIR
jgi:prepilin-type processing-associated H-X9-DG protein